MAASAKDIMKRMLPLLVNITEEDEVEFECVKMCFQNHPYLIPKKKIKLIKSQKYFEETIPKYSLDDFKSNFRMSRKAFKKLITLVADYPMGLITPEKQLLLTIWLLAHRGTYVSAGDRFGVATSSAHFVVWKTLERINMLKNQYICFPNNSKQTEIANNFEMKCKIPGIVGVIGGTRIPITQRKRNATNFKNKKEFSSIVLQGICDDNFMFTDIFIAVPGNMHDAKVFYSSPIFDKLCIEKYPLLPPQNHLIGDIDYPNSNFMITPYKNNGHLSIGQERFNEHLNIGRKRIEETFRLLKCKFRRLTHFEVKNLEAENNLVSACCILHNFIIMEDGISEEEVLELPTYENEQYDIEIDKSTSFDEMTDTNKRLSYTSYLEQ